MIYVFNKTNKTNDITYRKYDANLFPGPVPIVTLLRYSFMSWPCLLLLVLSLNIECDYLFCVSLFTRLSTDTLVFHCPLT